MCDPLFDPFCEPEPEVVEEPTEKMGADDGKDMDDKDADDYAMLSPLQGQITYLIVCGVAASKAGLDLFRYKSADDYFDAGVVKSDDTNWWKIASLTEQYTSLSLWGILFIFQLMSIFGVLTHVNLMLWFWAGVIGAVVFMVTAIFRLVAYETVWKEDLFGQADAIRTDSVYLMATENAFALPLILEYANWMYAQYLGLPEEMKQEWKESDDMFSF